MARRVLAVLLFAVLAGCGDSQQAAYVMGNPNNSLSLVRQQDFLGDDWTNEVVVSRFPDCQRRHLLKPSNSGNAKLDVYRAEPGVLILNQGKRWYVTTLATCQLQQYKDAPPEPGVLVGSFQAKDGELKYIDKEEKPAAAAPAAAK